MGSLKQPESSNTDMSNMGAVITRYSIRRSHIAWHTALSSRFSRSLMQSFPTLHTWNWIKATGPKWKLINDDDYLSNEMNELVIHKNNVKRHITFVKLSTTTNIMFLCFSYYCLQKTVLWTIQMQKAFRNV